MVERPTKALHEPPRKAQKKLEKTSMEILLQQIINGLVLGSIYALVALGYTMVYGVLNLINFAHGEVLMVGALTSWAIITNAQEAMPGIHGMDSCICTMMAQLVSAPTMRTSPCAKLIRLMMP